MKFLLRRVCAFFLVLVSSTAIFAASAEHFLPRRSVRAEFSRDEGVLLSDIRLVHKDRSFILIIGNEKIALRECFVAELVRNVDWDMVARYTDAGGKLLVKRLAPGEFEVRLTGGLDGGVGFSFAVPFSNITCSVVVASGSIVEAAVIAAGAVLAKKNHDASGSHADEVSEKSRLGKEESDSPASGDSKAPEAPGTRELEKEGRADAVKGPSQSDFLGQQNKQKGRRRWDNGESGKKRRIYEWDDQHKHVEEYDRRGRHTGVRSPTSGRRLKGGKPGRKIKK